MVSRVMAVASTDSGGGAGIMADLKTFTAMKVFGTAVVVSLTAQNSVTVKSIYEVPLYFINDQFDAIMEDIGTDAAKTGMLYSERIISAVTEKFLQYDVHNIVVDPVMVSKTNARWISSYNGYTSGYRPCFNCYRSRLRDLPVSYFILWIP